MSRTSAAALLGADPVFRVSSVDFDGSTHYMTRGAGLSGASDSKSGIFSIWIRIDAAAGVLQRLLCGANSLGGGSAANQFRAAYQGDALAPQLVAADAGGTVGTLTLAGTTGLSAGATWRHLLWAWDVAVPTRQFYLTDASDLSGGGSSTNTTLDFTSADWGIGSNCDASSKFNGCLAELYFAPGQFLDLSVTANRRKFIDASGKAVNLGSDGAVPTGTAPLIYLSVAKGLAASTFATNRGTGGNFTFNGTPTVGSSSPTD